jgi:hypothetical protein
MYNPLDQFISTPLLFNFKIALTSLDLVVLLLLALLMMYFLVYMYNIFMVKNAKIFML